MFHFSRASRTKPQPADPLADQPPAEPPATGFITVELNWQALALVAVPAFRVGEYEVGEGYCPRLCGHPGIRY